MEINYRKACIEDLDGIYEIVRNAIKEMDLAGISQWDDIYPAKDDFKEDIEKGYAHVGLSGDDIAVYYALSKEYDEQYANGSWQYEGEDIIVIHRLCVSPAFQNMGIAKMTLEHIEEDMTLAGVKAVKLDVFTGNPFALNLYKNSGYQEVGTANWRKGKFLLMEKVLGRTARIRLS